MQNSTMRFIKVNLLLALIITASPVMAQDIVTPPCQEKFSKLPALAKRLHVKPGNHGGLVLQTCDGNGYDIFAIINALLDRIDKAAPLH